MKNRILLFAALALLSSACSLKNHSDHVIQIQVPGGSSSSRHAANASYLPAPHVLVASASSSTIQNSNPVPLVLGDFTCYAVNVVGPGIPSDPRLSCPQTDGTTNNGLGVIAGFVPAGAGTVALRVPNGAARQVQLIGVKSVVGCTDLNTLLNNQTNNAFKGISAPYLLASTSLDIFADASVDLTAAFNPLNPVLMFQGCGGDGPSYPVTQGFTGVFTDSANAAGQSVPQPAASGFPIPAPAPTPNGQDIAGTPQPIPSPSLALISISDNGTTPPLTAGYSSQTITPWQRAVVQLQWDATHFDLVKYPYARVRMLVRGGQADSCATSQSFGVASAVWDNVDGQWILLNSQNYSGMNGLQQRWFWVGTPIPVPLSKLLITKSDGKQYVVVNTESNYDTNSSCYSTVYVAEAALQLLPGSSAGNHSGGPLWLGSNAEMGTGAGGGNYVVEYAKTAYFFANGGTPPYTYSVSTGGAGGSIDALGKYTAPAAGTSDTIVVHDSLGAATSATVSLFSTPTLLGWNVAPTAFGTYTSGTCINLLATTIGFSGTTPTDAAGTLSISGVPSGSYYNGAGCTTAYTGSYAASSTSFSFSVMPVKAGPLNVFAQGSNGTRPMGATGVTLMIQPGAFAKVTLFGSALINAGTCAAYTLSPTDSNQNPVTYGSNITVSSLPAGFYSDSSCTAGNAITTASIPAGSAGTTVYFKNATAPLTVNFVGAGTVTNATPTTFYAFNGIQVVNGPTSWKLSLNSANPTPGPNQCIAVDLTPVNDAGSQANYTGTAFTPTILSGGLPMNTYIASPCTVPNAGMPAFANPYTTFYIMTDTAPQGGNFMIQATGGSSALNPSNQINTQY